MYIKHTTVSKERYSNIRWFLEIRIIRNKTIKQSFRMAKASNTQKVLSIKKNNKNKQKAKAKNIKNHCYQIPWKVFYSAI